MIYQNEPGHLPVYQRRLLLTSPLASLATAGVTVFPGDREYTMGLLSLRRTWHNMSHEKFANNHIAKILRSHVLIQEQVVVEEGKKEELEEYLRYIGYLI